VRMGSRWTTLRYTTAAIGDGRSSECRLFSASNEPSGGFETSVVNIHGFRVMQADAAFSVDERFLLIPNQGHTKVVQSVGIIGSDDGW
jgi:hypothetical protein